MGGMEPPEVLVSPSGGQSSTLAPGAQLGALCLLVTSSAASGCDIVQQKPMRFEADCCELRLKCSRVPWWGLWAEALAPGEVNPFQQCQFAYFNSQLPPLLSDCRHQILWKEAKGAAAAGGQWAAGQQQRG